MSRFCIYTHILAAALVLASASASAQKKRPCAAGTEETPTGACIQISNNQIAMNPGFAIARTAEVTYATIEIGQLGHDASSGDSTCPGPDAACGQLCLSLEQQPAIPPGYHRGVWWEMRDAPRVRGRCASAILEPESTEGWQGCYRSKDGTGAYSGKCVIADASASSNAQIDTTKQLCIFFKNWAADKTRCGRVIVAAVKDK